MRQPVLIEAPDAGALSSPFDIAQIKAFNAVYSDTSDNVYSVALRGAIRKAEDYTGQALLRGVYRMYYEALVVAGKLSRIKVPGFDADVTAIQNLAGQEISASYSTRRSARNGTAYLVPSEDGWPDSMVVDEFVVVANRGLTPETLAVYGSVELAVALKTDEAFLRDTNVSPQFLSLLRNYRSA